MKTLFRRSTPVIALAVLAAACADPTMPTRALLTDGPSHTVTYELYSYPPGFPAGIGEGQVQLCKTADAAGSFKFSVTTNGTGTLPSATPTITLTAPGTACVVVYTSLVSNSSVEQVVITEDPDQPNWQLIDIDTRQILAQGIYNAGHYGAPRLSDAEDLAQRKATVYINNDMARVVTFENDFTAPPPSTGCTYTKGWYQNKNGAPTVIAVDGRTKAEAQAIFAATPGKPGSVTFGGNNALLNLYQQLLAALNNLGGDANEDLGPPAVDQAIDDAQDGTGGTGLNITTTLTTSQIGALTATLSAFNEGTFTGWPHCLND